MSMGVTFLSCRPVAVGFGLSDDVAGSEKAEKWIGWEQITDTHNHGYSESNYRIYSRDLYNFALW
jgi:hypothetical protein